MKYPPSCRATTVAFGSAIALAACGGGSTPDMTTSASNTTMAAAVQSSPAAGGSNFGSSVATFGAELADTSIKQMNKAMALSFIQSVAGLTNTLTVNCPQGGTADLTINVASPHQVSSGDKVAVTAKNCVDGPDTVNGTININFVSVTGKPSTVSPWNTSTNITFTNVTLTNDSGTQTANGTVNLVFDQTAPRTATFSLTGDTLQWSKTEGGTTATRTVSNFSTSGSVNGNTVTYRTGFTLDANVPRLGTGPYTVTTTTDFVQRKGSSPSQGMLVVKASSGNTVTLTALDPVNVNVKVDSNGDGTPEQDITTTWHDLRNLI